MRAAPLLPPLNPFAAEPLLLSAVGVLASGSAGSFNSKALANPLAIPIELLAIRWEIQESSSTSTVNGLSVGCQLQYGPLPMTNGMVPVWSFGRMYNQTEDADSGSINYHQYQWKLPRPMLIPPGGLVEPKFQHFGLVHEDLTIRISYFCRTAKSAKPKTIFVPFVASYVSTAFNLVNTAQTDNSTETDLLNSLEVPIRIERFVGRINPYSLDSFGEITNDETSDLSADAGGNFLTLGMIDSDGYQAVETDTLFFDFFNPQTRCWDVAHIMRPGAYYIVNESYSPDFNQSTRGEHGVASFMKTAISMIGGREVNAL